MFEVLVQRWVEREDCVRVYSPEAVAHECRTLEEAEDLCSQLEAEGQTVARWREK